MAFENLIIRNVHKIGGIQVDGIVRESTEVSVRATTNPVEFGADITDHIIRNPKRITLEGVATDTPLGAAAISNLASTIGGVADSVTGLFGSSEPKGLTRSQQVYKDLVDLLELREPIELITKLKTYDELIFESITVDQDKNTSRAVFFTATFIEIITVFGARSSDTVDQDNTTTTEAGVGYGATENGGFSGTTQPTTAGTENVLG